MFSIIRFGPLNSEIYSYSIPMSVVFSTKIGIFYESKEYHLILIPPSILPNSVFLSLSAFSYNGDLSYCFPNITFRFSLILSNQE